jgi:cysteine-S-conjugate beta-lyase
VSERAGTPHVDPFDDVSLELLRTRHSAKWTKYDPDVLPAWVAEMDFALALPVREVLQQAIARDDTGYAMPGRLAPAFAGFAGRRFGWEVDPAQVRLVADVVTGIEELLRALTEPGDAVVINPPVYPPFFMATQLVGREVVEVPLRPGGLDLDGLEAAFAAGAQAFLLCHPHNPTGMPFPAEQLDAVAELAAAHGVTVIADEVWAPLTLPDVACAPFLSLGSAAAETGVALWSASKSWNIAGLKAAVIVTASERMNALIEERVPAHIGVHAGHLGVLASIAAFEHGEEWLDALVRHLDRNRSALTGLLAEHLPGVAYEPPGAGYLAWLDCRELGLGDNPAEAFLERGRVALSEGPPFGEQGRGFARLNFGTSTVLLEEAVCRMKSALG